MSDWPNIPTSAGAGSSFNAASPSTPESTGTPRRITFYSGEVRRREQEEAARAAAGLTAAAGPSGQTPFQRAMASMATPSWLVPPPTPTTTAGPSGQTPYQQAMASIATPNWQVPRTTPTTTAGPSGQTPIRRAMTPLVTPIWLNPPTTPTTTAGPSGQTPIRRAMTPLVTPIWLNPPTTPTTTAVTPSAPAAPKKVGSQAVPESYTGGTGLPPSGSSAAPFSTSTSTPPSAPAPALKLGNHTVEAAAPTPSASFQQLADAPPLSTTYDAPALPTGNDILKSLLNPAIGRPVWSPLPPPPSISLPPPPPPPPGPPLWVYNPRTWQQELHYVSLNHPAAWETLVGLFFQETGRFPVEVADSSHVSAILREFWVLDARKQDLGVANPLKLEFEKWERPQGDESFALLVAAVNIGGQATLECVVRSWAGRCPDRARFVLWKAGWIRPFDFESFYPEERRVLRAIVMMEEGEERSRLLARAKEESPRFVQQCLDDGCFCPAKSSTFKRKAEDGNDPEYDYSNTWEQTQRRIRGSAEFPPLERTPPKKLRMSLIGHGQPTQFHGVPLEERAIDSKGNRLPWSLEWHEDHPNARGQKRHTEERGPFGKSSTRRHGSSRTRTATPAKKENPRLDGFAEALQFSAKKAIEDQQEANALARPQTDGHTTSHSAPSHDKEPTSVVFYGFSESTQWSAIDSYEKASHGMICEDYDREPPAQLQKYPRTLSSTSSVKRRPLTQQERSMAFKWAGGKHWIKVTFDSAEAANRAIEHSPYPIYGKWVYAELYHGETPADVEIPILESEQANARPAGRPAQTLSAAFSQQASHQQRATATLPRSFNPAAMPQADDQRPSDALSSSPSTASSATATGPEYHNLRNRHPSQTQDPESSTAAQTVTPASDDAPAEYDPRFMKHFQHIPRTVIRPASEAYPVLPNRWERWAQWLRANSLIPGDFIGDVLPRDESGNFDWNGATWYWRFWYTIDKALGTDVCDLKPDPMEE